MISVWAANRAFVTGEPAESMIMEEFDMPYPPSVRIHRAADRFRTRADGIESWHCFSHGAHYDPSNTHFGLLLASNEEVVSAGHGFDPHPHRDIEIVTWVLGGVLEHEDSEGRSGRVGAGQVQCTSAGSGVRHSEHSAGSDVRFVQMWVLPEVGSTEPGYARLDLSAELAAGELVAVASGRPEHRRAVPIRQPDAALHVARLHPGGVATLPSAPWVHVYVARGNIDMDGVLGSGDSARIAVSGQRRITAGEHGAEVLVWEMHSALGGP